MGVRRSHYEIAFERFLDLRGTPYVSVEDVRHHAKGRLGSKAFDYIVYPPGGRACLVDVKGRKTVMADDDGDCRKKNWVTRADVTDLQRWQEIFGPEFVAMFAFGYWLADAPGRERLPFEDKQTFMLAGRRYSFWLVEVEAYAKHHKQLSKSWDTVSIPWGEFSKISRRLESCWPSAPCR